MTTGTRDIKVLVDEILADGTITRAEQRMFNEQVMADGQIDQAERHQIDRLMAIVTSGLLKVVA